MAAKAWYKPAAMPELVAKFTLPTAESKTKATTERRRRSIEVWTTTCIVSNFGKTNTLHTNNEKHPLCTILINPANPYLSGPYTLPYFPRGGPRPAEIIRARKNNNARPIVGCASSRWGGMDVGSGMVFPAQTIDGMVHRFGGETLRTECLSIIPPPPPPPLWLANYINNNNNTINELSVMSKDETRKLCPEGMAIKTSAGGPNLQLHYDAIIHTTPPFYNHPPLPIPNNIVPKKYESEESNKDDDDDDDDDNNSKVHAWSKELLRLCYRHSFILAFNRDNSSSSSSSSSSVYTHYDQSQSSALRKLLSSFSSSSSNINSSLTNNNNDSNTANSKRRIAVPLLGAGCRGFPKHIALDIAANESSSWLVTTTTATATTTKYSEDEENDEVVYHNDETATGTTQDEDVIVFGLLEKEDANQLSARIKQGIYIAKQKERECGNFTSQ